MPSGKVHDAITFVLAIPVFAIAYWVAGSVAVSLIATGAFLFGGVMFGPDLDIVSRPYRRWGPARGIWLPYRRFFPHRSRFSHGLIFGALFRVVYFLGVVTIILVVTALLYEYLSGGRPAGINQLAGFWEWVGRSVSRHSGSNTLLVLFVGLWTGAASHTFTDMAGSFIKTGRSGKFF